MEIYNYTFNINEFNDEIRNVVIVAVTLQNKLTLWLATCGRVTGVV